MFFFDLDGTITSQKTILKAIPMKAFYPPVVVP